MKKIVFLLYIISCIAFSHAQVGINTTVPSSNAVLDLNSNMGGSNYGGFLPPRITVAQRDLIPVTAADDGLIAYVTFANGDRCLQIYNGLTFIWESIKCNSAPISTPGTVFSESMGDVTGDTNLSVHEAANGFDNDACLFSSSGTESQIRNTNVSPTASGASGSGNAFLTNTGTRDFLIENISATTYTSPLTLELWIFKSTTASNGSELTIEYYDSATSSWVNVSVTNLPTSTATWYSRVLSTVVPNTITKIRFTRAIGGAQFRIDDIKIIKP